MIASVDNKRYLVQSKTWEALYLSYGVRYVERGQRGGQQQQQKRRGSVKGATLWFRRVCWDALVPACVPSVLGLSRL